MSPDDFFDLVSAAGAVYYQEPRRPEGYVLSGGVGPAITHIVNLIDSVQIAKGGSDTIELGTMCDGQPTFVYNPQPASGSGNPHIRRTGYSAVASCLQSDWSLIFETDDNTLGILYAWDGSASITGADSVVRVHVLDAGPTFSVQLSRLWGNFTGELLRTVTGISKTHHIIEVKVTDTTYEVLVDGVPAGSGTWTAGTWGTTISAFQSGANSVGPDTSSADHRIGQMILIPDVADHSAIVDEMVVVMCNGFIADRRRLPHHYGL